MKNETMKKNILVIDDDKDILSLIKDSFKDDFNVIVACDGQEGLQKFTKQEFNLVISDFHIPKLEGDKLVIQIREAEKKLYRSNSTILIITGDKMEAERKLKDEARTFIIEKPFSNETLLKLALKLSN